MAKKYWHSFTIYQIYPRSFKDSNADGKGDIRGIIEKLPYLEDLGIDFIWLNPIYKSPMVDNGYDISDYYVINDEFGTLDDFKELLTKAHARNIRIMMDLVVNHTSDQHPWFLESKKSKDNPYRDYYLWQNATSDCMPNDWQSFFGTSAWTYDENTQQAYFHVFSAEQPDLNWKNPKVREEIYNMIRFWLEFGVDGFRMDAISHIQKEDWHFKIASWEGDGPWQPFMNVSGIDTYMKEMKQIFDEYGAITVGEASGVTSNNASIWTGENGYMDMILEWEHNVRTKDGKKGDVGKFIAVLNRWQKDLNEAGWNALYLENHDIPRVVSTFGDGSQDSAKAFACAYFLLKGTPFIYQGQELGLTNTVFNQIEEVDAIDVKCHYANLLEKGFTEKEALIKASAWSRDHARLPMQWTSRENAGFSKVRPWLKLNENYKEINVERQLSDPNSVYNLYKKLIHLRHTHLVISEGNYEPLLEGHEQVFVYRRNYQSQKLLVMANLTAQTVHLDLEDIDRDGWSEIDLYNQKLPLSEKMILSAYEYHVYTKTIR